MSRFSRFGIATLATTAALALLATAGPGSAMAEPDPVGCTQDIQYDPSIPTFKEYADANGIANNTLGGFATGTTNRHPTAELYGYMDAVAAATVGNPRVRAETRTIGTTELGREFRYVVVSTPDNIANLDSGRNDGAFWRGVRQGTVSAELGAAQAEERPAFFWNSATPHGNEPAAGEAVSRVLYELTARLDCSNVRRLENLDNFLMPARSPDGRDNNQRTTAWSFDPNRDFASRNQDVNRVPALEVFKYPGPVFIDAHQQSSGYFFPPNEDPILHEISDFSSNLIQDTIGPALQERFNDQSGQYRNYNTYDLYAVEYGDTVPSLQLGAAGMTFEKGNNESYGKQVYDHYIAMDETMNVISDDKDQIMREWSLQWEEAQQQGEAGALEPNELVSPLTPTIIQQPNIDVFGYYYLPGNHTGDTAKLVREMVESGVHVYRLDAPVNAPAAHEFGPPGSAPKTLPAGTLWIPMNQTQKHWIQGVLGEDPFIPVPYFYDVVNWSFSQMRGQSGNGFLTEAMPGSPAMTEISEADFGNVTDGAKPVLAFPTDSAQGLAMVVDLLRQDVTVFRSDEDFTVGPTTFPTGTALVDASTLGAVDIAGLSDDRQVPVTGLDAYPVDHHALTKPKIGIYTDSATVPSNPAMPTAGSGTGHCGATGGAAGSFCEALNVLSEQLGIPVQPFPGSSADDVIYPITSTDLAAGRLVTDNFTAFVNPARTIAAGAGATALQAFVNAGGRYVGSGANGTTSARNAGLTNLNTQATNVAPFNDPCLSPQPAAFQTPGTLFTAEFDTTNPVAWGFDSGGFVYRNGSGEPVYNPATLPGAGPVPNTNVAISYADPITAFGYTCNATGPGELPGRPAVADATFGSGHATMLGFNPWYRAWVDVEWRMALNAILYPTGPSIEVPDPPPGDAGKAKDAAEPASEPIPDHELPAVSNRPVIRNSEVKQDARLVASKGHKRALKRTVRKADLPNSALRKARYTTVAGRPVFSVPNAWTPGEELDTWVFDLGLIARNAANIDTNIPARSH